jgi:hypothetical protein
MFAYLTLRRLAVAVVLLLLAPGPPAAAQGQMSSPGYTADCLALAPAVASSTATNTSALTVAGGLVSGTMTSPAHQARLEVLCLGCGVTLCGDCTGDGAITILDALAGARHAVAIVVLTGVAFASCDVDRDGDVDVLDSLRVAQAAVGLSVTLICCA